MGGKEDAAGESRGNPSNLDLMSRRWGSTRHERATKEIDDEVSSRLEGAAHNSQLHLMQTASP